MNYKTAPSGFTDPTARSGAPPQTLSGNRHFPVPHPFQSAARQISKSRPNRLDRLDSFRLSGLRSLPAALREASRPGPVSPFARSTSPLPFASRLRQKHVVFTLIALIHSDPFRLSSLRSPLSPDPPHPFRSLSPPPKTRGFYFDRFDSLGLLPTFRSPVSLSNDSLSSAMGSRLRTLRSPLSGLRSRMIHLDLP